MDPQEGSKALGGCPSPVGQGTPVCLALLWVPLVGTSCAQGWWLTTRYGAGWLAGEGASPSLTGLTLTASHPVLLDL